MIEYIKGILKSKNPGESILESNGIGYRIHITLPAFEALPKIGEEVKLVTYFHVKENPMDFVLYGFSDERERECFRQIISVSGIGPKTGMSILSAINYREFVELVAKGNYLPLTSISGVGKKTAERLALELKDKIAKSSLDVLPSVDRGKFGELSKASEVIQALLSLGYTRLEADKMARAVSEKPGFMDMQIEDIIKHALKGD